MGIAALGRGRPFGARDAAYRALEMAQLVQCVDKIRIVLRRDIISAFGVDLA